MIWNYDIYFYILTITKQGNYHVAMRVLEFNEGAFYGREEIPKMV